MNFCLDIETLATPEQSGYGIVIPNYAIVKIPEVLTSELEWMYVQLPIQDQLDLGLKMDASAMNFWFNICANEFPIALREIQKSFTLKNSKVIINGEYVDSHNIPLMLRNFLHCSDKIDNNIKVFGNGCNFDCSILQENHRVLFGEGNLWHYSSPNNIRTLRLLLNEHEEHDMIEAVNPVLNKFSQTFDKQKHTSELCLHNPIFDAANEALFATYILNLKKSECNDANSTA